MTKKIFSIILSISLLLSGVSALAESAWETTGNNLISNGEFSTGVGNWYQQIGGMLVHDSTVGHNAPGAGLITNRTSVTQQVYQLFTLEEGETYLASAWVKLKDSADDGKEHKVQLLTSNSTNITDYGSFIEASSTEWRELKKTIVVDDAAKNVQLGFANYSDKNLEFYIDDVSLMKIDTSRLYPSTLVLNGATAVNVPQNGTSQIHFRCTGLNQHGGNEGMHTIKSGLDWSLVNAPAGVAINNDGVLTVEPNATTGTVTVYAEYTSALGGTVSAEREVEIRPSVYAENGNLIANGDFEKIVNGEFSGNVKIVSDNAFDGDFSAFVSGGKCGQYVYLNPGKKYFATAMVNANNSTNQFSLTADNENIHVTGNTVNTENNEWYRISAVIDTTYLTQTTKVLVCANGNQSPYYADSFFLAEMKDEYKECDVQSSYYYGEEEKKTLINGELSVKAKLSNGDKDKNLIVVAALYKDKNANKLEDVSYLGNISLGVFETKNIELPKKLNITNSSDQLVKIYVWDNNLAPQKEAEPFVESDELVFHVYPNGQVDSANNIFTTIDGATNKMNQMIKAEGATYPKDGVKIILHEGVYKTPMYFLGNNNEGEPTDNWLSDIYRPVGSKPVTFKAADNEDIYFSGDKTISPQFVSATQDEKNRLIEESAREHLVKIDLKAQGITIPDEVFLPGTYQLSPFQKSLTSNASAPELIVNGKVMQLSRYPNKGHILVDNVIDSGEDYKVWENSQSGKTMEESLSDDDDGFIIAPSNERFKKWTEADNPIMYGYWDYSWADQAIPIKAIDTQEGTITSKYPSTYEVKNSGYFYVYNLLEEIDTPGEYYIDKDGILYLYPPLNTDINNAEVSITQTDGPLMWFRSTHDIVFDGIKFGNTRGSVVFLEGGTAGIHNIVFKNCSFKNTGGRVCVGSGIMSGNGFLNCDFQDVNGGVSLLGGRLRDLTPGNNFVENCTFDNFSRINETYNSAIGFAGVGNRAIHNTIKNAPHSAISFSGCDHIIEHNDISNVLQQSGDMAAIYVGRSWISRGNKVRYNYIHDIKSNIGNSEIYGSNRVGVYGLYLDDLYSGMEITGNVLADIDGYAILINGGRDNIFKKNVIVNTYGSIYMTSIGLQKRDDVSFESGDSKQGFLNEIKKVREEYDSDKYFSRFPELYCIEDNEPFKPIDNIFSQNLMVNSGYQNIDAGAKEVIINKDNLIYTKAQAESGEVGFIDYTNKNYNLDINSSVFNNIKGFYQFSLEKTGALED